MAKSNGTERVINVEGSSQRSHKRKDKGSPKKIPLKKHAVTVRRGLSKKIEICDLEPSKIEMAMPYMNDVQYKKPVQPKFSPDSRRDKSRIEKSVDRVGMSGKSGPSVLLLTDSSVRHARVPDNDDDDFVDPPPIWQETSPFGKSPTQDCSSAAHHSPMEK
ncbi:Hypothetical predicted protein [Olea europaea subsp. europaea]|uniref:Uncharacterized protein n=1 Tax=Olea europaea subsp. europaea TaxID=158383 RepID=A0A8S0Q8M1_OLEEU|nr:Hypothetical predicted protein [Olea europaea subsp. europaea]